VHRWLTDGKRKSHLLEPFQAYEEFVTAYTGQPTPLFGSVKLLNIDRITVGLLGLNSAWMCARQYDRNDPREFDDFGSLIVGEPQIHEAFGQIESCHLRITLVHHPLEWLARFDRDHVEEAAQRNADFILCGHQHIGGLRAVKGTGGKCVIIPAGASYDRRYPQDPKYANGYNFVKIDWASGHGTIYFRTWGERRNEWIEDNQIWRDGKYDFELCREPSTQAQASPPRARRSDSERLKAAARDYRDFLLKRCDIIDITNLPAQDVELAQRELALRRLYVPLRAQVAALRGRGETALDIIEQRRTYRRRGNQSFAAAEHNRISIGERLGEARRLVVLGDPGAGKTTLTRWIATAYLLRLKSDPAWSELPDVRTLPDEDLLPIIVRCRELDDASLSGTLDDVLTYTLRKAEFSESRLRNTKELLLRQIDQNSALLLLDGLDEITDPFKRRAF
jgi:hypothetical protein